MKQNFHRSIQKGKLLDAIDMLLNENIDEDTRTALILLKMKLSLIERAVIEGRVNRIENELELKNKIAYQLLKIYNEIQN